MRPSVSTRELNGRHHIAEDMRTAMSVAFVGCRASLWSAIFLDWLFLLSASAKIPGKSSSTHVSSSNLVLALSQTARIASGFQWRRTLSHWCTPTWFFHAQQGLPAATQKCYDGLHMLIGLRTQVACPSFNTAEYVSWRSKLVRSFAMSAPLAPSTRC